MKPRATSLALVAVAVLAAAAPLPHFGLSKSMPEKDSEVTSPEEVRLWFTQVPQENSMSVRLIDASQELVEVGELAQDPEDGKIYSLPIPEPLPVGAYSVAWRAIGQDGHVVRGDFSFSVKVQFSTR